ncbi:MAG: hypothetical protein COY40_03620 [Alphaproteobacteria bacterium CG_4_10_14_0_8_um_filter_53_9]|nr:MAG: hypothetical protein COY40_03620 [Alphaproteobacteria bacterium CG_4_10_14_0_8_um_filter_53_9]
MTALVVFDFDDTLAMTGQHMANGFFTGLEVVVREDLGLSFPHFDDFVAHCRMLNAEEGNTIYGFARRHNRDDAWAQHVGRRISPAMLEGARGKATLLPHTLARLDALKALNCELAMITHGLAEIYTLPMLEALGLSPYFPPERVHDIAAMNGRTKLDPHPYRHVMEMFPETVFLHHFMLEDSAANLVEAKANGFTTLLIRKTPQEHETYVDHSFEDVDAALAWIVAQVGG